MVYYNIPSYFIFFDSLIYMKQSLISRPMSGSDISKALGGLTNIIKYSDLTHVNNLTDTMVNDNCVLLYETNPNYGHWCCFFLTVDDHDNDIIEFFDPYGLIIDDELKYINDDFREAPMLTKLLINCPLPVSYNHHQFQKMSDDVSTCGKWCVLRLKNKNLSLNDFIKKFGHLKDKDVAKLFI